MHKSPSMHTFLNYSSSVISILLVCICTISKLFLFAFLYWNPNNLDTKTVLYNACSLCEKNSNIDINKSHLKLKLALIGLI